jgi:8-oxo-dGTP pyrophosphatase MutT (NUDIX family)
VSPGDVRRHDPICEFTTANLGIMAISLDQISGRTSAYLAAYPEEKSRLAIFVDAIGGGGELTARSVLPGHVTTGAFLLDADDRLLQIAHRSLGRWLNPGGHVEPDDVDLPSASLRELTEESGIPAANVRLLTSEPFDIDVHLIPANPAKGEPEHWHYDLRYAFRLIGDGSVDLQVDEVDGHRWIGIAALGESASDRVVRGKLPGVLRASSE